MCFKEVAIIWLAAIALTGCNPFESKLIGTCENVLKERLRSPSGYTRVDVKEYQSSMSRADWLDDANKRAPNRAKEHQVDVDLMEKRGSQPTVFKAFIDYDAPNAYGTLIRGVALCEYISTDGTLDWMHDYDVRVDGMTKLDWMMKQVRESQ